MPGSSWTCVPLFLDNVNLCPFTAIHHNREYHQSFCELLNLKMDLGTSKLVTGFRVIVLGTLELAVGYRGDGGLGGVPKPCITTLFF